MFDVMLYNCYLRLSGDTICKMKSVFMIPTAVKSRSAVYLNYTYVVFLYELLAKSPARK